MAELNINQVDQAAVAARLLLVSCYRSPDGASINS